MIHPIWRLSEYTPDNLGLAFTGDGLLLGRTPLFDRRGGRFVVRERSEIARLVKYSFPDGVAVDRLMPGLARVASALNANDPASARIAAVHLQIPDLPHPAKRDAMIAEDALIKYVRDEGGGTDWNPALHPRAGMPPNAGWFATTGGSQHEPSQDESSTGQSRLRVAANDDGSHRIDAAPTGNDQKQLQPGNPFDEPANFTDRPDFWSDVWPAIRNWLQEPVPVHDLESGEVVGERSRWEALAPYIGIPIATAAIFGLEAFAPAIAAWLGLGGRAAGVGATAEVVGPRFFGSFAVPEGMKFGTTRFGNYAHYAIEQLLRQRYPDVNFIFRTRPGQTWLDVEVTGERSSIDAVGFGYAEIKPLTAAGKARFNRQVLNWDLSEPVQPITYDAAGHVFLGFH